MKSALIGYGYWGPNLARNIWMSERGELVAICERSSDRAEAAKRAYPTVDVVEDWEAVVGEVDCVFIATPPSSHHPIAAAAFDAGAHVFVEKPLTTSLDSSRDLVERARDSGRTLMVDHTFPFTGAVQRLKALVDEGELGDLLYFDSWRVNLGLVQDDVNVLWDLAIHDLSILEYVVRSAPVSVSATGAIQPPSKMHSTAFLTLTYPSSFIAHIDVSWMSPVKVRKTLVAGTKKMVVYDDLEPSEKIKIYDSGVDASEDPHKTLISYRVGDMTAPRLDGREALAAAVAHFYDCVESGKTPINSGEVGARIVAILEAATESMWAGGAPVTVEHA